MKKKRYASGGMTQADIDAGLTQADVDAGLRGGKNERISDEDRQAALRSTGMAESFPVAEPKPQMRKGLNDQEAAKLMGREVRHPVPKGPKASTLAFEANYPAEQPPYQAFEDNYPGPRQVKVPTRKDYSGVPNSGKVGTATNKPFAEDVASSFTKRVGRAESNSPLSKDMVNNPAKARLMQAISKASGEKYDQDSRDQYATDMQKERDAYASDVTRQRDAALVAQQLRSDFGPYKKGGIVKKMAKGGTVNVSSASRRGDGIAQRGKTKGRMV
jgi:hypothetical protein